MKSEYMTPEDWSNIEKNLKAHMAGNSLDEYELLYLAKTKDGHDSLYFERKNVSELNANVNILWVLICDCGIELGFEPGINNLKYMRDGEWVYPLVKKQASTTEAAVSNWVSEGWSKSADWKLVGEDQLISNPYEWVTKTWTPNFDNVNSESSEKEPPSTTSLRLLIRSALDWMTEDQITDLIAEILSEEIVNRRS